MTLRISKLSKRFANNWVLRDVEFDVEPGQVLAVLGAKGSGKSTLLRILCGLEQPSPANLAFGLDCRIGVVSPTADTSIFRFFSRRQSQNDIGSMINTVIGSGQSIVALDDPVAALDRETRSHILERIRDASNEKQLTVIYATADFETAATVADRIAVLADGSIQQIGTPEEIYESPANTRVALLTGRCNLIEARRLTSTKFDIPEFQTVKGDHRLFAERADIAKLGAINRNVYLAIRPEDISMSFGASFPEDNLLKAVVTGVKYLGPITIVELHANGLELEAAVLRLVGLDVGQECVVGLPPDRVRILRD